MESINKIIEGLEHCELGSGQPCYEKDCPYYLDHDCLDYLKTDIIARLKEQEERIRILDRAIKYIPQPTKLLDVFGNDYAKIVKCKHCIYGEGLPDGLYQCHYDKDYTRREQKHSPSWFCADGKRREQNELER